MKKTTKITFGRMHQDEINGNKIIVCPVLADNYHIGDLYKFANPFSQWHYQDNVLGESQWKSKTSYLPDMQKLISAELQQWNAESQKIESQQ